MPIERKTKPAADRPGKGTKPKAPANKRAQVYSAREDRSGGRSPIVHTAAKSDAAPVKKAQPESAAPVRSYAKAGSARKPVKKAPARKAPARFKPQLSTRHKLSLAAVAAVLLIAGLIVGGYFLTKVKSITVAGNSRYTAETIINRSGLYTGRNTLLYDLDEAKKRIEEDPFLICTGIRRVFPSGLEINVKERREYGAVAMTGGNYCVIDDTGYVLSVGKRESLDGLIPIYGLSSMGFSVGTRIDMDKSKLRPYTVMEMITALGENSYKIREIDISNASNVKLVTTDGVTVYLGDSIDIPAKIQRMFKALAKVDPAKASSAIVYVNTSGTTDLSYPTAAPTETPEPAETPEPSETPSGNE